VRIGIDLDDVVAECAVPYLRAFAERYRLDLPDEDLGWQTLAAIEEVSGEEKDRFRIALYDGKFFSELEPYEDSPAVIERIAGAGHEIYFITARAERRRVVTETWLREKGLIQHARAIHLKPHGDFDPGVPPGRYDATSSAKYKVRLATELERLTGLPVRIADPLTRVKVPRNLRGGDTSGSLAVAGGSGLG